MNLKLKNQPPYSKGENKLDFSGRFFPEQIKLGLENTIAINFELTEKCNLKCDYCAYGDMYNNYGIRQERDLDLSLAFNLLDYMHGLMNISSKLNKNKPVYIGFYGGEPSLKMDKIKEIVNYIESKWSNEYAVIFSMTTNGLLLKQNITYFNQKGFELLISIDGNKENNSYRKLKSGGDSYPALYNNLKFVQKYYPLYFDTHINFNSVIHDKNNPTEVTDFLLREFGKKPTCSPLSQSGVEECWSEEFKKMQNNNADISKHDLYKFIRNSTDGIHKNYIDLFYPHWTKRQLIPTAMCIPFSRRIHLCADGTILPCEKIGKELSFGKVDKESVKLNFVELTNTINLLLNKAESMCENCSNNMKCGKCLFQFVKDGQLKLCPDFTTENDEYFNNVLKLFSKDHKLFKTLVEEYNEL